MVYSLAEIQERITPIAIRYGLKSVFLFGSYARGEASDSSDIDLLVDTTGTNLKGLFALGALYSDLEDALGKKIDMVTLSSIEQQALMPSQEEFRREVLHERVKVYNAVA